MFNPPFMSSMPPMPSFPSPTGDGRLWAAVEASGKDDAEVLMSVMQAADNPTLLFQDAGGPENVARYLLKNYFDRRNCGFEKRKMVGMVMGAMMMHTKGFPEVVHRVDPEICCKLATMAFSPKVDRNSMMGLLVGEDGGDAALLLSSILRAVPEQALNLLAKQPQIGHTICHNLPIGVFQYTSATAAVLEHFIRDVPQSYAIQLCDQEKNLASSLKTLFFSKDGLAYSSGRAAVIGCVASIISRVPGYATKFLDLAQRDKVAMSLMQACVGTKDGLELHCEAVTLIGGLCEKDAMFADIMIELDKKLPEHLSYVLKQVSTPYTAETAAKTISQIVKRRFDFVKALQVPKLSIGPCLCHQLGNGSELARKDSAAAIAGMIRGDHEYAEVLLASDRTLVASLGSLLSKEEEDAACNAALAIAQLSEHTAVFSREIIRTKPELPHIICRNIENENTQETTVLVFAELVIALCQKQPAFTKFLLSDVDDASSIVGGTFCRIAAASKDYRTITRCSRALIVLAQKYPPFARDFGHSHADSLRTLIKTLKPETDPELAGQVEEIFFLANGKKDAFSFSSLWSQVQSSSSAEHDQFQTLLDAMQNNPSVRTEIAALAPEQAAATVQFCIQTCLDSPPQRQQAASDVAAEFVRILCTTPVHLLLALVLLNYLKQ